MSRLEVESKILIKIFQVFSNKYKTIISRKDLSFYKRKYEDGNNDLGNFEYVINKYTGDDYKKLNDYLFYFSYSFFIIRRLINNNYYYYI